MTTAAELRNELQALGVTLAVDGDRLRFSPRSAVTGELLERLRTCKAELLAMMLQPQDGGPSDAAGGDPQDLQPQDLPGGDPLGADGAHGDAGQPPQAHSETTIRCPWCSSRRLLEGTSGLWCADCERLAWEPTETGGLVRCDVADLQVIDLPTPCPDCGGIVFWWDAAGGAHCEACEPRTRATWLREHAQRLRERHERNPRR